MFKCETLKKFNFLFSCVQIGGFGFTRFKYRNQYRNTKSGNKDNTNENQQPKTYTENTMYEYEAPPRDNRGNGDDVITFNRSLIGCICTNHLKLISTLKKKDQKRKENEMKN